MKQVSSCEKIIIAAPRAKVFDIATTLAGADFVNSYGPIPGILSSVGDHVPWRNIGDQRTHRLSDGSSVNEELIAFVSDQKYIYRVSGFSGLFDRLVSEAHGEWVFESHSPKETSITWVYSFTPNGLLESAVTWVIVKLFWQGYLRQALAHVKEIIEEPS